MGVSRILKEISKIISKFGIHVDYPSMCGTDNELHATAKPGSANVIRTGRRIRFIVAANVGYLLVYMESIPECY